MIATDNHDLATLAQKELQRLKFYAGKIDGIWGPRSDEAFRAYVHLAGSGQQVETGEIDARSEKNILTLEPAVQSYARKLVLRAREAGIKAVVTSGSRTYAEQDALYAQGRSKPGIIVTDAKGGQSNHNFGIALDLTVFVGAEPKWEGPEYDKLGAIGESLGFKWGGRWKKPDRPHFEYNPKGYSTAAMRARVSSGQSVLT